MPNKYEMESAKLAVRGNYEDGTLTHAHLSGGDDMGNTFSVKVSGEVFNKALKSHLDALLKQRLAGIENLVKESGRARNKALERLAEQDRLLLGDIRKAMTSVESEIPVDGDPAQSRVDDDDNPVEEGGPLEEEPATA